MRYFKALLKTVFVLGLLYYLSQKGLLSVQNTKRALGEWRMLVLGLAIMGFNMGLGALRWQWLLQAQDLRMKWWRVFELTMVGNFFNIALPGAVSGDFVKAFYIGKEAKGKRAHAFGSILFDRVVGLSALILVSGMAMAAGFHSFSASPAGERMISAIEPFVLTVAIVVITFYSYLFIVRERHDPVLLIFRKMERLSSKLHSLTKIYEACRHYHHHRVAVTKAFAISVCVHILVGSVFICLSHALGEDQLALLAIYTVFPLGLLVTAIPVAPAGVGTGHAAFAYFFQLIGSGHGADVFTLYALISITLGGIGGLFYLRFRTEAQPSEAALAEFNNA